MNWTPQERAAIAELAAKHGISTDALLRQALHLYQLFEARTDAGEKCVWSGDRQRLDDFVGGLALDAFHNGF